MNKIEFPPLDKPIFSTNLKIRIYDLNYGNHVGSDSLVSLIHEARVRFLMSYGFTELDIDGVGILITNLVVSHKAEAFYGDEIRIDMGIANISKTGLDFIFNLKVTHTNREMAKAITTATFFDYKKSNVVKVPQIFLDVIQKF